MGKHSITAGIDLMHQHAAENTAYPTQPLIGFGRSGTGSGGNSFSGIACPSTGPQTDCSPWGGYLADYMVGAGSGYMQGAGEIADVAGWQIGPFIQDDWKILPNLTINLGLRWDPNTPPVSQGNRGAAWIPGTNSFAGFANSVPGQQSTVYTNAPAGLDFPGDPGVPNTLMNSDYNYWEPRIGVAYQPKALPHTVFHAGAGMFTGPLQYSEYNHAADVAPFSPTFNFSGWDWDGTCGAAACPDSTLKGGIIPLITPGPALSPPIRQAPSRNIPLGDAFLQTGENHCHSQGPANRPGLRAQLQAAHNVCLERLGRAAAHTTTALRMAYVGNETEHLSVLIDMNPPYANTSKFLRELELGGHLR